MGQLHSKTQIEMDRLRDEKTRNKEVWKSSSKLAKVKNDIFED